MEIGGNWCQVFCIQQFARASELNAHADTMTYNSAGQLLTRTDPLGRTTTITYNARGLPATITDPLGRATTLAYDLAGRVTATTDPAGRISGSVYDPMNRVTRTTAADSGTTQYGYDLNGDLLTLTDPNTHARSWTYDARRRVRTATDALSPRTVTYDPQGNVVMVASIPGRSGLPLLPLKSVQQRLERSLSALLQDFLLFRERES